MFRHDDARASTCPRCKTVGCPAFALGRGGPYSVEELNDALAKCSGRLEIGNALQRAIAKRDKRMGRKV